ncbi:MAG: amidohydrolase, partial [Acidobacteria bacterium]
MRISVGTLCTLILAASVASLVAQARGGQSPPTAARFPVADLVLTNGRIITLEDAQPEVQAIAIGGDRITALGSAGAMEKYVGPNTQV